jgi:hypothetical protein
MDDSQGLVKRKARLETINLEETSFMFKDQTIPGQALAALLGMTDEREAPADDEMKPANQE